MARKIAPTRIWATVNGARSVFPSGVQYLIGGWESAPREHGIEYIRSDVVSGMLEALKAVTDWQNSEGDDPAEAEAAKQKVLAAIAKAERRT